MKNFRLFTALVLCASIGISGCNTGDDDTNAPSISTMLVNGVNALGTIEVLAGNTITVSASITEDVEMDSYRIQVVADFIPITGTPFSYDQTTSAAGLSATVNESIAVPANSIAGPYEVIVSAIDASGRESESTIVIAITSPTQASINVTTPSNDFIISFNDTILMSGTVTDDVDLVSIEFVAEPMQQAGGLVGAGGPFYEGIFNLNGSSDTSWDMSEVQTNAAYIIAPATGSTGLHKLEIRATDSDGNVAVKTIPFNIF